MTQFTQCLSRFVKICQDLRLYLKTNGHFLEETQITDLYAFGNLYVCLCLAQALITILGIDYSKNNRCYKKIKIRTTKKAKGKRIRIRSYFHVGLLVIKFVITSFHYEYQLFKRLILYDV